MRGEVKVALAFILSGSVMGTGEVQPTGHALAALPSTLCSALTVTLHPGMNPPAPNANVPIAPDAPRGNFTVSLPVYANQRPLKAFVASPYSELPGDPYVQTASAEYRTPDGSNTVRRWANQTFAACGWHQNGSWSTNANAFTSGVVFTSNGNQNLSVYLSLGARPSGGTYIGYAIVEIILPARPLNSYLQGHFFQVRIAVRHSVIPGGSQKTLHLTVQNAKTIRNLVSIINNIAGRRTVLDVCFGGLRRTGPAWFTFVRRDGSVAHAFETGPGPCGGMAVNGVRWLTDPGGVWSTVLKLANLRN